MQWHKISLRSFIWTNNAGDMVDTGVSQKIKSAYNLFVLCIFIQDILLKLYLQTLHVLFFINTLYLYYLASRKLDVLFIGY